MLFTVGGDGTLRGAQAIDEEVTRRGLEIAVVGIPKTIDNDISYIDRTFGFETAVRGAEAITAPTSRRGAPNGVGLVKLMGRDSGFIAAYATLADSEVNFCLVPEVPFTLDALSQGTSRSGSQAGPRRGRGRRGGRPGPLAGHRRSDDASGNVQSRRHRRVPQGPHQGAFQDAGIELNLKYIDPSYIIRSVPANANDAAFCLLLGHNAVHAGMTGRTNMVVGHWKGEFTHVPIPLAVSSRKKIDRYGWIWSSVLASTGQPASLR